MNIELYINNRLCDIGSPESLGIYLKRVFINPAELSVKDAQKSYEISLPATPTNNEIFNHTNVEEVQGKFKVYDNARLYINGILILDGKFRMSEVTHDSYKGNLGVPAPITVKDIFGETMMNQAGKWTLPFYGVDSLTAYNTYDFDPSLYKDISGDYQGISPVIFPFVLYGLLPKDPVGNSYTKKDEYDETVRFDLKDFLPSVNCVHMLKKIFKNADYTLTGSAIDDERIKNLYVSYKNPEDYELFWGAGEMKVKGKWSNYYNRNIETEFVYGGQVHDTKKYISTNIFSSKNISGTTMTEPGVNITESEKNGIHEIFFKVPYSGLYKLEFDAAIQLHDETASMGAQFEYPSIRRTSFNQDKFEIKVVRYSPDKEKLKEERFDNTFFRDNQKMDADEEGAIYPTQNNVHFVDPKQNKNYVCGFSWGQDERLTTNVNPISAIPHNPMAISGGKSWDALFPDGTKDRAYSAVYSPGYAIRTASGGFIIGGGGFDVELTGIPEDKKTRTTQTDNKNGSGYISQIIWLEKNEYVSIISTASMTYSALGNFWPNHSIDFTLSLTPFMRDRNWLTVNDKGSSTNRMRWDDSPTFAQNEIDLIKFLSTDAKINDWIDNFCKTFNLEIISTGAKSFELNIKKNKIVTSSAILIDLDKKANTELRTNESLKLPYLYELNFTVDTSEEGYYETMEDEMNPDTGIKTGNKVVNSGKSGNGVYYTNSNETSKITQNSSFSYCWYKEVKDNVNKRQLLLPVITDHEVWEGDSFDYEEMQKKFYPDKNQRFWYKTNTTDILINKEKPAKVALVSNDHMGKQNLRLDYENKKESIMNSFFLLLINGDNNYTAVECYLSPEEYANLDRALVKFNGDLYDIADVDGYDPTGTKKCKLKLIRRIE